MIEFNHKEYGGVIIAEDSDKNNSAFTSAFLQANVVAYRNVKEKRVRILKDRFNSILDREFMQFILNYEVEFFNPIESRYDILDL